MAVVPILGLEFARAVEEAFDVTIPDHEAVELNAFIATLERLLGRRAIRNERPMQPGDVPATFASIDRLRQATGFAPHTPLAEGLAAFVAWYRDYYAA